MRWSVPPDDATVADFAMRLDAHDPLLVCEEPEEDRVITLIDAAASRLQLPVLVWRAHVGLSKSDEDRPITGTEDPLHAVAFIDASNREAIYHLRGFDEPLRDGRVLSRFKEVCRKLQAHRGAVVLSGPVVDLPREIESYATYFTMPSPTLAEYRDVVQGVLSDLRATRDVTVALSQSEVKELYEHIRGLSLSDARRVISLAVVKDGKLSKEDFEDIREMKRKVLERTGVLSYVSGASDLGHVAGLAQFKDWIKKRSRAFSDPEGAKKFGLTSARGVLLIGVQGCGKSLAAKAVAGEWKLPVVRLDPGNLFSKYVGETEKTLRRTLATVESMAPLVLWIDELEKAFSDSRDNDGGVSKRLLGSLLAWLQEHRSRVFVVATANDISSMPPELLRKGRFDELFFVDLPETDARHELFGIHLTTRGRIVDEAALRLLASETAGFSGAEIEQAVVAALHAAFSGGEELTADHLLTEVRATTPLSATMAERIAELRGWAEGRTVRAD